MSHKTSIGWTFAITSIALFMVTLDNLVVTTALPVIRVDLHSGLSGLEWTVNAYTLTFAVLLLTGAALGDRFGRRRMFTIGISIFTLASAAAALAPSIGALDAARAVQGVGGAIVMPLTLTILSAAVPEERRGLALGAWGGISGLAVAIGPLDRRRGRLGDLVALDLLAERADRPGARAARAAAAARVARPGRPRSICPGSGSRAPGSSASSGASSAATRSAGARPRSSARSSAAPSCSRCSSGGSSAPRSRCCRCGSSATGRSRSRTSRASSCSSACSARSSCWRSSSRPCRATRRSRPGLRILPWTAMPIFVSPIAGALSDRVGGHRLMGVGLALQAIGLAWIAAVSTPTTPYSSLVMPFILSGAGMAMFFAPVANVVLSSVRRVEEGQASGANNAIRELGGVFGVAVLASIFAHYGGYTSGSTFVDGMNAAVYVGAAVVAPRFGRRVRDHAAAACGCAGGRHAA